MPPVKRITADGSLVASGVSCSIFAISLAAGSDAATVDIKEGGSGGTIVYTLKAAANESASVTFPDSIFVRDAYVDLTGTSPAASFNYAAHN